MSDIRAILAFMFFFLPLVMMFFYFYLARKFDRIIEEAHREGNWWSSSKPCWLSPYWCVHCMSF